MIELQYLTEEEKVKISVRSEPVFLVAKKHKVFHPLFNTVSKNIPNNCHTEVWMVLTCILKALKYNMSGARISLNKNHYTYANKVHNQRLYKPRVDKVLEILDNEGYITFYKGYRISDENKMTTTIFPTQKFMQCVDVEKVKRYAAKRDPLAYVEVKDKVDGGTVMLSLKDFRGYSILSKQQEKYNKLLSEADVTIEIGGVETKCGLVYKRVFFRDLEGAGRFYACGKFQVLKSETRCSIKISGQQTTEKDYANLHPRMLYTMENIELSCDWDAYSIEGVSASRDFIKKAYLALLFSSKYESAVKSILKTATTEHKLDSGIRNKKDAEHFISKVKEKNEVIWKYFFQEDLWSKLQHMDSRLASHVIYKFTEDGEVCLGWHDSFVVRKQYGGKLERYMEEAWYNVFGTYKNFKITTEF